MQGLKRSLHVCAFVTWKTLLFFPNRLSAKINHCCQELKIYKSSRPLNIDAPEVGAVRPRQMYLAFNKGTHTQICINKRGPNVSGNRDPDCHIHYQAPSVQPRRRIQEANSFLMPMARSAEPQRLGGLMAPFSTKNAVLSQKSQCFCAKVWNCPKKPKKPNVLRTMDQEAGPSHPLVHSS